MQERGVRIFSITDHDTLKAYGRFKPAAGVRVVTGIEINASYMDGEVHILGYRLPLEPSPLSEVLERNRHARRMRVSRIVAQLRDAGHDITM
jgi:predicted metal-dependent phosphoesterase TrpH